MSTPSQQNSDQPASADRWQRVIELFDAAVACAPSERTAMLAAACGDNNELRREVEGLLDHDERAEAGFLTPPEPLLQKAAFGDPTADDRRVGATVAGYRLIERIASGGMGTVYRARQEKLQRDVALKIVRPGLSAASALRQLEHEARYLARLRHPHIAQIFEAGTFADPATGATLPYFVMELVEGAQPITAYCRNQNPGRKSGADAALSPGALRTPRPPTGVGGSDGLSLPERLGLFLQICDAVHHGHQRGLIHRDLKPSNILVDAAGLVKIIDFGVARSTDADITLTTLHTDSGQLIGTLQYMSPEQCAADVADLDVRSDVYSLGVVLYELVCGHLPYDLAGATVYTAARIVCDQAAEPPRTSNPRLPRDLEAILLKCLEKHRTSRYQSAAQLGDDILRYLAGETISARPPGLYRRVMRWTSRHAIAATAAACALMLILTTVLTTLGVYIAGRRPNRLWISPDACEVQLQTVAGRRTGATLRGANPQVITAIPEFLANRGQRIAIIGLTRSVNSQLRAGLWAFDVDKDLTAEGACWRRNIRPSDIPPPPLGRSYTPANFGVRSLTLIDIFPEREGLELVAIWGHDPFSWGAFSVYSLDGELLYQFWHDGHIAGGHIQWLSREKLLILPAVYCTHEPWRFTRGMLDEVAALPVVFAMRPQLGQIETKLISVPELAAWHELSVGRDTATGPRTAPVWYKFVWPLQREHVVHFNNVRWEDQQTITNPAGAEALVSVTLRRHDGADLGTCFWSIDATGAALTRTDASDGYRHARDVEGAALPPPEQFRLVDLETILADPFGEIAYGTATDQGSAP